MSRFFQNWHINNLRGDIFGGITAGIVALPLALVFGVKSVLGAIAGLYGAIALGIFAAAFGGTAAQISGPTGPMTVVLTIVVNEEFDRSKGDHALFFEELNKINV